MCISGENKFAQCRSRFFLTTVLIVTMVIVVDEVVGCRCFLLSHGIIIGTLPILRQR
jgi:hypothetical protein